MKKVLLTGASGFVGGNFLRRHGQDFEIIPVNLRKTSVSEIDFTGVDSVLHCAALVHQMQGAPESEYFKVNCELTKQLAEKAKNEGVQHFVFVSTAHVYGDSGTLINHAERLTENSPRRATDPYGKSKIAAEDFLLSIQDDNFRVAIVRPPMVYGKGAKGNIISLLKLINLCPLLPFNFQQNKRSIVFVGNLCQMLALIISKKANGAFLPQDKEPLSIAEMVTALAKAANRRLFIFRLPGFVFYLLQKVSRKTALRLYGTLAFDNKATTQSLDFVPRYSTFEGFRDLAD